METIVKNGKFFTWDYLRNNPKSLIGQKLNYTEGESLRSYQQDGTKPSSINNRNTFLVESSDHHDYVDDVDIVANALVFVQSRNNHHVWILANDKVKIGGCLVASIFHLLITLLLTKLRKEWL